MAACEKCWEDAYQLSIITGKTQGACYAELLEERKDTPCSPQQQAGQFWDDEKKVDKRRG
jgi:hypothetical protein